MNRELKIFLKRLAIFLLVLPFIWFLFICLWGTLINEKYRKNLFYPYEGVGFLNKRIAQADSIKNIDVLILGSSHVYRGIDPRILNNNGLRTFTLGSSLQTPIQTKYFLKKYLKKMNPKIVILEVSFLTFSSDGIEGAIDVVSNVHEFDSRLLDMATTVNSISVYNSLAYSFFAKKILKTEKRENKHMTRNDQYVDGGFVEAKRTGFQGIEKFEKKPAPMLKKQRKAFETCLDYLKEQNVKYVLVQTPVIPNYYLSIENRQEYKQYFESKAPDAYLDFTESYKDEQYFYDFHHLNRKGVERFTRDLFNAMQPYVSTL